MNVVILLQVHELHCLSCSGQFDSLDSLLSHLEDTKHITEFISDKSSWDQPE